jgi:hypothetical protein
MPFMIAHQGNSILTEWQYLPYYAPIHSLSGWLPLLYSRTPKGTPSYIASAWPMVHPELVNGSCGSC